MRRQELYQKAQREVERRRQLAETRALHHQRELYAAEPRLAELDGQKQAAGAAAARLAANGNRGKAAEKLAEVKRIASQKEQLLAALGVAEAQLAPRYHCAICGDTGRAGGEVCTCVLEEVKRLRREEINESGPLSLCSFDCFDLTLYPDTLEDEGSLVRPRATMQAIVQDCRDWAAEFGPKSKSLYMFGYAGLGKTHLALSIASEVLAAGYDVIYVSSQSAFSAISADREKGAELFYSMLNADLLVLDDLGTEFLNAYILGKLYELVNGRARRPTIYTTNICSRKTLDGRYDEKITSRLLGECHLMRFWGEDIRLRKR